MYVKYACIDTSKTARQQYFDPTWEMIESLIKELDGKARSYVMMCPSQDEGAERIFVVRVETPDMYMVNFYDGDEYQVINLNSSLLKEELGEGTPEPTIRENRLEDALIAAKAYFEKGIRAADLHWKEL